MVSRHLEADLRRRPAQSYKCTTRGAKILEYDLRTGLAAVNSLGVFLHALETDVFPAALASGCCTR